ncbi:hypothetical protein UPYG_G00155580 [Umbra pygmaea]|uniref:Ig-like domain-containing protein n=1 Tax=Umbra pygmaea TaxID=75934 RepID=A0ABD0WYJ2_UMBPY
MFQVQLFSFFLIITGFLTQEWSMTLPYVVNGTKGGDVVLPCTFTHPQQQNYSKNITVKWIAKGFDNETIFQCKVNNFTDQGLNECWIPDQSIHFSLKGDPKRRDLSLLIRDLVITDSGKYFCKVELNYFYGSTAVWQNINGTQLNVMAKAQVISLSRVEASPGPGNVSLMCVVKGNPRPTITWLSSNGPVDIDVITRESPLFQWESSIPYFSQDVYTCRAENSLGMVEKQFPPGPSALAITLYVHRVLLLVLPLGAVLFCLKKRGYLRCNSDKSQHHSVSTTSPATGIF